VYYISEVLHDAKTRYLEVHKLLYVVHIASKKLRHHFQAHKISVVTSYPLRAVLHNPNATGNIAKWAVELAEFKLDFIPRHAVKCQVLADFTPLPCHPRGPNNGEKGPHWTIYFEGSSHKQGTEAGILLLTPDGEEFKYMVHLDFKATNNTTEYEALTFGLSTTLSLGVRQLLLNSDYQLIIKQVNGECCCNNPQLVA
jgi:hypothetical protein